METIKLEIIGQRLTDPAHGGKCDIWVYEEEVRTLYQTPFVVVSDWRDEDVEIASSDFDCAALKGRSIYDAYLILKNILEKRGWVLDIPT